MKKTLAVMALLATLGFLFVQAADARWEGRRNGGCGGCGTSASSEQVDPAVLKARQDFLEATADLRRQLFEKRGEYAEVMNQDKADKEQAAKIWGEIFDLQSTIRAKAEAAGISSDTIERRGKLCNGPGNSDVAANLCDGPCRGQRGKGCNGSGPCNW